MDKLKESQLTQRATRRPCEYNYTNADIHTTDVQPSDGYQFEYPVNWTGDQSTHKVIGLRRISYKAPSINLSFIINITYGDDDSAEPEYADGKLHELIPISYCFTSDNTFEECWVEIMKQITDKLNTDNLNNIIILSQMYNKDTGDLKLIFENGGDDSDEVPYHTFKLVFRRGSDKQYRDDLDRTEEFEKHSYYKKEFLKLFNQILTPDSVYTLHTSTFNLLDYHNVWNRDTFYCHASFSDSPRKIIGINKDFWESPSVFYEYSDNSNDFNVYFTTDTVHRILPRNGTLLIQISYIFNYQTSYLTY